jgi:L-ornithine N5-oxygenase
VFDPDAVGEYYFGTERTREAFWRYHRNTNYSVADSDVITDLYQRSYDEDVAGEARLQFLNLTRISGAKQAREKVCVSLSSLVDGHPQELEVDAVVCATGYGAMDPTSLLGDLDQYCLRDEQGRYRVQRDYRIVTGSGLRCGIYLQGGIEHSHGLTASLLSNTAVRGGEIADAIVHSRAVARPQERVP